MAAAGQGDSRPSASFFLLRVFLPPPPQIDELMEEALMMRRCPFLIFFFCRAEEPQILQQESVDLSPPGKFEQV